MRGGGLLTRELEALATVILFFLMDSRATFLSWNCVRSGQNFFLDLFRSLTRWLRHLTILHAFVMASSKLFRDYRSEMLKTTAFSVFRMGLTDSEETELINRRASARSSGEGI